jgi:predicted DNA-binding transcriptional regulator YafY
LTKQDENLNRIDRLLAIIAELLIDEGPYSVQETAKKYGVTPQMIRRDLHKLITSLNEANQRSYIVRRRGEYEGNFQRSIANLSSEVLVYLFLSLTQLKPMLGEKAKEAYDKLWRHALSVLPSVDQRKLNDWSNFYYICEFAYPRKRDHFYKSLNTVFESIRKHRMLSFTKKRKERVFDPYGIYYAKKTFYLLGKYEEKLKKNEVHLTRLDRVTNLKSLENQKTPLLKELSYNDEEVHHFKKNQVKDTIKNMLEAERDRERRDNYVFYILDKKVKDRIQERQWHHSQVLKDKEFQNKGRKVYAELRFSQVESPVELKKWVLGWGSAIEVIEPTSFRKEIKQEILKMSRLYASIFRS